MNKKSSSRIIARKLIVYILLCSSLITLIFTSYQLYLDYHLGRERILDTLQQIEDSYLQAINRNVWTSNEKQLATQLEGILELHDMQYIRIEFEGNVLETGQNIEGNTISRQIPLTYVFDNKEYELGTLFMSATLKNLYERLFSRVLYVLLTQGIIIFIVSIFIFFIFHYLITRHLYKIAGFLHSIDINKLDTPLILDRQSGQEKNADELDDVVNAFNEMSANLASSYASLNDEITERKKAEEEISLQSEIMKNINEGIYLVGLDDGKIKYTNPEFEKIFGCNQGEMIGKDVSIVNAPTEKKPEETKNQIMEVLINTGEWHGEVKNIKKDGTQFWSYANVIIFDHSKFGKVLVSVHTDITERLEAEKKIENLAKFPSENPNPVLRISSDGNILYRNEATLKILNDNGLQEKDIFRILPENLSKLIWESCKNMQILKMIEVSVGDRIYSYNIVPLPECEYVNLYGRDITERKMTEEKLRASEEKYRTQFNEALDAILLADAETGIIIDCNPAVSKMVGREKSEIIGQHQKILHPPEENEGEFSRTFKQHLKEKEGESLDAKIITKGGEIKDVSIKANLFEMSGRKLIQGIFRDITERKQLEEEQQKMQKLESVGILAGGIAHDFNNLLAAVRNNVYLSMIHIDRESEAYDSLASTEKIIHRATNLTQQLLTFSRGGAPVKKTASIVELIKESAEFVLKGSNVSCDYKLTDSVWPVEVDEGQMNQVVHNLILNADQAMPDGGTIQISTENINLGTDTSLPLSVGRYVKIIIEDHGVGIADDHLQKLFDPYFTTKEMGRGLGLSVVFSIIRSHNGHIHVESELGAGTTFSIYIPASEKLIEEKEIVEDTFAAGEGKILLMDDEAIIRETAEQLLTHKGYEVECAKDGDESIELYKKAMKELRPYDVVILDLTIRGGMGGKETVKKLLEIDPDVKAIVASGYSNDPVLANYREYGFCGVFAKHDKVEELGKTLHEVINGQQ